MGSRLEQNSSATRKRIEQHAFANEDGEEYSASSFGGFTDYMRRKKIKLQNLDAERRAKSVATNPQIFRGMVIQVNGYTQPSLNDLHALVVDHGGGFLQYLDGKTMVTHIIASNLTPKKREEFKRYRIVKPAWIVDSVKAGKLLPWDVYRLLDDGPRQKVLGFQDGQIVSQKNTHDQHRYREQTETSWYTSQLKPDSLVVDSTSPSGLERNADSNVEILKSARSSEDTSTQAEIPEELLVQSNEQPAPSSSPQALPTGAIPSDTAINWPKRAGERESDNTDANRHLLPAHHDAVNTHPPKPDITSVHPDGTHLTAEEHNEILLADPKVWRSTVVNPGFLKQYYEESRLHHLSTWKAELKSQLQAFAQRQSSSQKARSKRPKGSRRYVLHVDFDSFFVAVSVLQYPQYKDLPLVVAHGGGAGAEIASCNYPARTFGVKNGMWMKTAQELCRDLKVLPYDFKAYEDASRQFYEAIMNVGGIVQSVSVDEALIDVSNICIEAGGHDGRGNSEDVVHREQARADGLAQQIRDEVFTRTKCAVSVGIGGNILQAKLALRKAKPAGQYQIKPEEVLEFIGKLSVQDLPGVAYSIGKKLGDIGVKLIQDVRETSKERLISTLGPKTGERLWEYSRGVDRVEVGEQVARKSVSAEVNWGIRFVTQEQAEEFICNICEELERRLSSEAVKGRQFSMKIMRRAKDAPMDPPKHLGHGKCDVFNKSVLLGVSTNDRAVLMREALSILRGYGFSPGELRGIGVQMTRLEPLKRVGPAIESSQRLLAFGIAQKKKSGGEPSSASDSPISIQAMASSGSRLSSHENSVRFVDPAQDQLEHSGVASALMRIPTLRGDDELESPHKPRARPMEVSVSPVGQKTSSANFLNTTGTQFILPSQVDPKVLSELPVDIRSRFKQADKVTEQGTRIRDNASAEPPSPTSPIDAGLPSHSQLDPETLAALPENLRAEILAQYRRPDSPRPNRQVLLPQSPRKVRSIKVAPRKAAAPAKRATTTSKVRTTRSLLEAGGPTLTQANFVAIKAPAEDESTDEEISVDFLAALPEDIRSEVLEQQRRGRLRKKSGLDVTRKTKLAAPNSELSRKSIELQSRVRPTFTSQKLSSLPQLRQAMDLWYQDFQDEEPAAEDIEALAEYLSAVIIEEHDLSKATAVVKWLAWVIDNGKAGAKPRWSYALSVLENRVQASLAVKGLGPVEF